MLSEKSGESQGEQVDNPQEEVENLAGEGTLPEAEIAPESADAPEEEPAAEAEAPAEPPILETVPVEEQVPGQLLEACPSCGTLMDVTTQEPFAKIYCPSCGQNLRARRQFNNFQLIEHIGEGGMGAVFRSLDCNLHRQVALKILKKECAANAEEQAKLEQEARITASINHPHVVKIFSFGQDHGQFYLAMELVEKGSLDQLMTLQHRVPELQVLNVGIQIAEGLEAGLEKGLIHRDIKPGNILFSDPHTAKLVDFGLAVVMDEAASVRGEIWGTPYYIAPEKLDNQPEDFRSDIYSLGGTLFHALAGRPPYEAETASMVALKQLKSQPVSLQSFAPDVSSETAYVINRMLAKDREDRYPSYRELIDHLSYARHKLLERTQKPQQPKARVVMETQETRNLSAYLSLGLIATIIIVGVLLWVFRDKLFGDRLADVGASSSQTAGSKFDEAEGWKSLREGVKLMNNRQFTEAGEEFQRLAEASGIPQPLKNWALMNQGLALMAGDEAEAAAAVFNKIAKAGPFSSESEQAPLASFFVEAARTLASPKSTIASEIDRVYSNQNYEAFGLLCFAMHDWVLGQFDDGGPLFRTFSRSTGVAPRYDWITDYKKLAEPYVKDYALLSSIQTSLEKVKTASDAQKLLSQVKDAQSSITTGNKIAERLQEIESELKVKGAKP
ncbi:MAG: serine/threonine protein kinase [Verrucomicrobia bacterium]|nr:serine/threonine protein kinase [Verrucomicrobiota bacterium]